MSIPTSGDDTALPTDLQSAHAEIRSAHAEIRLLREHARLSERRIRALQAELEAMAKRLFGKRSEKLDPRQLRLALELVSQAVELSPPDEPIEADSCEELPFEPRQKRKGRSRGRRPLPQHLPRRREVIDVEPSEKVCACGQERQRIGETVSEKIDYVPASYTVVETVRPKYACPSCHDGVATAPPAPQAVEKGLAAEGFIAHVVVSKYADHLPLHRQERILARQGLDIRRSTLGDMVAYAAEALQPIADELKRQALASDYLQTDDTPIVVLEPDVGGSLKGRVWTYLDPLGRRVVFDATRTHERKGIEAFLGDFKGYLQADAYSGYDGVYRSGRVVEVACWAHARRRFVTALDGGEPRAAVILSRIQQLYAVEHDGADLAPEERRALRQERARPILQDIDVQRRALQDEALPKSPLGDALRYLENQWPALLRYLEDGRLRPDNNGAESQLRSVALGRKNWLFAGSMAGAQRAAVLYSLVQSCKLAKVEPFAYLRDLLLRVATHPHSRIAELTPAAWAATFAKDTAA